MLVAQAEIGSVSYVSEAGRGRLSLDLGGLDTMRVEALKRRAAEHGRSAEAEHRIILEKALCPGRGDFWKRAAELREETRGRSFTDSTDLIRQDRDER